MRSVVCFLFFLWQEGQRGCAFVRYASPHSCAMAIEALHGKYAMKAGELPLVVRYACLPSAGKSLREDLASFDELRWQNTSAVPVRQRRSARATQPCQRRSRLVSAGPQRPRRIFKPGP